MDITLQQALERGIAAHKAGRAHEADQYYTAVLKANPRHPDANHNMGVLAVGLGKTEAALPFFKAALEINSNVVQFWLSYVDALIKLSRVDEAKKVLKQAKQNGVNTDLSQFEVYKSQLNKIIGIEQERDTGSLNEKLNFVLNLCEKGEHEDALHNASKILIDHPNSFIVYNIMGAAYQAIGETHKAIEAFEKSISINPNFADAHNNLGLAYQTQGKPDKAIDAFNKAISINPKYADAYYNRGLSLDYIGNLEKAVESYIKVTLLKPKHAKAYYSMGMALKKLGKLKNAKDAYHKAIALEPSFGDAYNNLGNVLKSQGLLEDATQAYEKSISINPKSSNAFYNLGIALQELGRIPEAAEAYNKAISINPKHDEALWNQSGTVSDIKEAKFWIKKCLAANPQHQKAMLTSSALQYYEGNQIEFGKLINSTLKDHPYVRSFNWVFSLPHLPPLHFHRWALFDHMVNLSLKDRPFYEFGVWRGEAFRYLMKTYKKGFGFDTFEGLPEDWHHEQAGTYSSEGNIPKIKGGEFIVGKFDETLPTFFEKSRPMASIINFDADLYSSTICALNYAKRVIDKHTILIFDEFLMNNNWEDDEHKALVEFCSKNNCSHEVIAVSFFTKQVAVKLINI